MSQCANSTDSIIIKLKDNSNDYREIFRTGYKNNRTSDEQWVAESIEFHADKALIYVSINKK